MMLYFSRFPSAHSVAPAWPTTSLIRTGSLLPSYLNIRPLLALSPIKTQWVLFDPSSSSNIPKQFVVVDDALLDQSVLPGALVDELRSSVTRMFLQSTAWLAAAPCPIGFNRLGSSGGTFVFRPNIGYSIKLSIYDH